MNLYKNRPDDILSTLVLSQCKTHTPFRLPVGRNNVLTGI